MASPRLPVSPKLNVSVDRAAINESVEEHVESSLSRESDHQAASLSDYQLLDANANHFASIRQEVNLPDHLPENPSDGVEEMIVEFSSSVSPGPSTSKVLLNVPKRVPAPFQGHKYKTLGRVESDMHYVYCGEVDGKFGFLSAASKIPNTIDSMRAGRENNDILHNVAKRFHGETPEFRQAIRKWVKPNSGVWYQWPSKALTRPDRVRCLSARAAARQSANNPGIAWPLAAGDENHSQSRMQTGDASLDDVVTRASRKQEEPEEENREDEDTEARNDAEVYLRWLKHKARASTAPQKRRTRSMKVRDESRPSTAGKSDKFGPIRRPISSAEAETRGKSGSRVGIIGMRATFSPRRSSFQFQQTDANTPDPQE